MTLKEEFELEHCAYDFNAVIDMIAEDRQQIKDLIERTKKKYCLDKWFDKDDVSNILNELKEKL